MWTDPLPLPETRRCSGIPRRSVMARRSVSTIATIVKLFFPDRTPPVLTFLQAPTRPWPDGHGWFPLSPNRRIRSRPRERSLSSMASFLRASPAPAMHPASPREFSADCICKKKPYCVEAHHRCPILIPEQPPRSEPCGDIYRRCPWQPANPSVSRYNLNRNT